MKQESSNYTYYSKSRISNEESIVFFSANLPLAGEFLTKDQRGLESTYPLTLSFCPKSTSVQVNEVVHPKKLFSNYFYKTGDIKTLVDHLANSSEEIKNKFSYSKIMDVGCNDFSFLRNFIGYSDLIVGVDPSNISKINQPNECNLENDFFTFKNSQTIKEKYGEFDLIFSSNNFAHIENLQDYTKGIANLLSSTGSFVCEIHWVGTMLEKMQFPFIYHEHMYYHTLKALIFLLNQHGLYINDVQEINIHGGSIRFFASKENKQNVTVQNFLQKEEKLGLYDIETYHNFANKIQLLKENSRKFFNKAKQDNKKIYAYGASGQGNTLMSIFEITKEDILYIIDDSPIKNGLFSPKNHIEIKDKKFLETNTPDFIYLLAYTFEKEIKLKNLNINTEWILPI
jgi:hypothetical protein